MYDLLSFRLTIEPWDFAKPRRPSVVILDTIETVFQKEATAQGLNDVQERSLLMWLDKLLKMVVQEYQGAFPKSIFDVLDIKEYMSF